VWCWLATGLLLAGAAGAVDPDRSGPFAATLPASIDDVSGWQMVTGSFETGTERGSYRLYVNPARAALYQLMRYRIELVGVMSPQEQRRGGAERVAFIRHPGVREPMVCWERLGGAVPGWREVPADTDEYRLEMGILMRVLNAHRAARRPASP
jgi:hypothetical protein